MFFSHPINDTNWCSGGNYAHKNVSYVVKDLWSLKNRETKIIILFVNGGEQAAGSEKILPSEEISHLVRSKMQEYKEAFHVKNKTKQSYVSRWNVAGQEFPGTSTDLPCIT